MKPGEEIRLVKENLAFVEAFWKAATAGRIPPEPVLYPPSERSQSNPFSGRVRSPESDPYAELVRGASNQMRAGFAVAAQQAHRSMAKAFPGEPIQEPWPELRAARSAIYLVGLAVQRSILQPVWECPPPYRRQFQIRRIGFTLNAAGLEGRVLSWDDFGGLDRFISLLEYCVASAGAAADAGANGATRTLPGRLPSLRQYGGVIGSPATADEPAPPPASLPPRGYPGNNGERRLAPDAPPFEAPRKPVVPDDGWDIAVEEQMGRWHFESDERTTPEHLGVDTPVDRNGTTLMPAPVNSIIQRFIAERCETGADQRMLAGELYASFVEWCIESRYEPVSQRAFGMRLTNLGLSRKRRGHGKHWWVGICLAGTAQSQMRTGTSG